MSEEIINLINLASSSYHLAAILVSVSMAFIIIILIYCVVSIFLDNNYYGLNNEYLTKLKSEIQEEEGMYEIYQSELKEEDFKQFENELQEKKQNFEILKDKYYTMIHIPSTIVAIVGTIRNCTIYYCCI